MKCRVSYSIDGQRASTTIIAPSTTDALLMLLKLFPDDARVAAIVSVLKPAETY